MSPMAAQMNGVGGQGSACFPIMSFRPFNNKPQAFFVLRFLIPSIRNIDKKQSSNM